MVCDSSVYTKGTFSFSDYSCLVQQQVWLCFSQTTSAIRLLVEASSRLYIGPTINYDTKRNSGDVMGLLSHKLLVWHLYFLSLKTKFKKNAA